MHTLERRLNKLEQSPRGRCECRSWQPPITELAVYRDDELPPDLPQLPEKCPACGRTIPIRCIIVHETIVERPAD